MSNDLAIATVTAGLQQLVARGLDGSPLDGTDVNVQRPDDPGQSNAAQITVFLYQVSPNPAWRNEDLPTRDGRGAAVQRPRVALDLDYLLTFFGSDVDLVPHRLLGLATRQLHSRPILGRGVIEDAISAHPPELDDSDLADQEVPVRLSPLPLSLEELSKLWSVFFQIPYALSIAYRASVVLIEADETPRRPLPVLRHDLFVAPLRRPRIECAVDAEDAAGRIFGDGVLALEGSQLAASIVRVWIDGEETAPAAVAIESDVRITVELSSLGLTAGVHRVQVVQPIPDAPEHLRFASNAVPFLLHPRLVGDGVFAGGDPDRITVVLDLPVDQGQQLVLLLNELLAPDAEETPRAFVFERRAAAAIAAGDPVAVEVADLPAATYLVRLQVDGAESPLTVGGDDRFDGPTVVVP